jgi:hypothetical protein
MLRSRAVVTALAILIPCGILHGLWTDRWVLSEEPGTSAAKLSGLPLTIGEWDGREIEIDSQERAMKKIAGYLVRRYENRLNGSAVSVLLVCGRPGPVSVHPPDVCYAGSGYELAAPPLRCSVPSGSASQPAEFWAASFLKQESAVPVQLHIFWAWSATGVWKAPDNPRLAFAGSPVLYKLYVLREGTSDGVPLEDDPCKEFIQRLLPELVKTLFGVPDARTKTDAGGI